MNEKFENLIPQLDSDIFDTSFEDVKDEPIQEPEIKEPETKVEEPRIDENDPPAEPQVQSKQGEPKQDVEVSTIFYNELVEQGIVSKNDEKQEYSWEDVNQAINSYKEELPQQVATAMIQSSPEIGRNLIDYVFTKGNDLSKDDLKTFFNDYLQDLNTLEKNYEFKEIDQARNFLTEKYKAQGIRESQIPVMLDALEDESENAIFEEAKKLAEKDKENLKHKVHLDSAKQEISQREQEQKQLFESINQELNNLDWKSTRINKIKNNLVNGQTNKILSVAAKSPKALIQLANLATYYNEKTQQFDFDDFINQITSKEASRLENKIKKEMLSTSTKTKEVQSNPNTDKFKDLVPISPV